MKKGHPEEQPKKSHSHSNTGNNVSAQRARLLVHLEQIQEQGCSTIEAREELDIIAPAPRVHELRWSHGKNIQTIWDVGINAQGKKHRVARYVLLPGEWEG